jgi:glycosyltransferase involved in cell wall biosynthesis
MLEAMAMRMPIVCYEAAAAGLDYVAGSHFCVEEGPREFAARVLLLLKNPAEATAMAAAGRGLVEARYGWDISVQAFETVYGQVIEELQATRQ